MAKFQVPKFIDNIIFPDLTAKHWRLFKKYLATSNRIHRFFLLVRIRKIQRKYNASIPVSNKITPFCTPHGLSGIFISAAATIGPDCTVFQNVTLGSNTIKGHPREGGPQIGSGVLIGANAVVIGKVTVGDNARIGAGCAVACDVPAGATAVSRSPKIIAGDPTRVNTFRTITESQQNQ